MADQLGSQFAKLWTASTTSALGSGLATIAAPLYVAAHTKSPLIVSVTTGVAWLPWLLFALPGGVLVDRVDRRRLMVAIDWTRVGAMGVLATALLTGWSSIALLDAVLFIINAVLLSRRSCRPPPGMCSTALPSPRHTPSRRSRRPEPDRDGLRARRERANREVTGQVERADRRATGGWNSPRSPLLIAQEPGERRYGARCSGIYWLCIITIYISNIHAMRRTSDGHAD